MHIMEEVDFSIGKKSIVFIIKHVGKATSRIFFDKNLLYMILFELKIYLQIYFLMLVKLCPYVRIYILP